MSETRIIKKYPNRRLYDTEVSSYITLEDVRHLVLQHVDFSVQDAKSKQDITRSILLQIILEREEDGEPMFSETVLQEIIRFYGDSLQGMMTSYLEKSLKLFVEQQDKWRGNLPNVVVGDPLSLMRDVAEQNLTMWKEMQESFFSGTMPASLSGASKRKRDTDKS
ncbi:MAG: polyhydroxyalkanoate synthesis repressor PhaR [Gammaproteobacteria bacterium]|nr:polyhydroxyalkanoate synthesis repressor PhaR [Gammaproteobacteria bacterium]MDX2460636.1 polyhydroxyalkanoate synthesis repressor PhaR [Gammaproteobacteria bacterium]